MPASHDLEGLRPPGAHDRVGLLLSVSRYVGQWQQVIETGTRPSPELISRLNQPLGGLQAQAVAVGFGGLSHHIGEFARLLGTGADVPALRGQLTIVSELAWQARQTLTPEQKAHFERGSQAPSAGPALAPGMAPPPMITVARSLGAEATAALRDVRPAAPPPPAAASFGGPPPMVTVAPGVGARSAPAPAQGLPPVPPGPSWGPGPAPIVPGAVGPRAGLPPPPLASSPPLGPSAPPPPLGPLASSPPLGPSAPPPPLAPLAPSASSPPLGPSAPPPAAPSLPPLGPSAPPGPLLGLAGPPPANAPAPVSQFGVKNMLGLRAFDKPGGSGANPRPNARSNPPAGAGGNQSLLSLPGFGATVDPKGASKPPMIGPDPKGLPPLEAAAKGARARDSGSNQTAELLERMRPERASGRPQKRSVAPPKGDPRRPIVRGRSRGDGGSSAGLWVGIGAGTLLVTLGLVAYFTLRRPPPTQAVAPGVAQPTAARTDSSSEPASKREAELPRERLLADNERFTALLAQVHGHGGKETPELRSLLNDQAALASKALSGKCTDGSFTCKAWAEVRDLMVGERNRSIVKRGRSSDSESTRSRWMVGLKMPGIPVADDPRVLRVFEFYTQNPVGRETFQSMLFRCGAYKDLIQSTLIRYDMPPDLMALAFTESGCEPSAKSPVGAAGLWQFMPETARAYHLRVIEGTIDERYSPFKSTEASIRMLADLRQKLGSWDLVFASYNLGPFGVLARVERAGGDASFWDLVDAGLLPDETANYSPTVQAIALILANLQRLKFTGLQIHVPVLTADLEVPGGTRLGVVARAAATSVAQLRTLNLDFTGDVVPLIPGGAVAVQVNKDVVWQARDSIKELLASKDGADQCVPPTFDWGKQRFTPEMVAACQRRLAAAAAAGNSPPR